MGAFGVVGGCLLILAKFAALVSLPASVRTAALLLTPVMGRWSMVFAVFAYPYARGESGKGFAFKEGASRARMLVALMYTIVIAFIVSRSYGMAWR